MIRITILKIVCLPPQIRPYMKPLKIRKVAIYGEHYKNIDRQYFEILIDALQSYQVEILIAQSFVRILKKLKVAVDGFRVFDMSKELTDDFDMIFTLGGDGTILSAVTHVKQKQIPILGINTGRLGFLAGVKKQEIKAAVVDLFKGAYRISKRSLLSVVVNDEKAVIPFPYAMNEVTVSRRNNNSMIGVKAYISGAYLTTYWADGLIIATPTGCTGYSLSCQGPVMLPQAKNFVITPIAPHNLNARPLVISDDNDLQLEATGRSPRYMLSLDNRAYPIGKHSEINIQKADFEVHLVELNEKHFLDTLRKKLLWGEDARNYITD